MKVGRSVVLLCCFGCDPQLGTITIPEVVSDGLQLTILVSRSDDSAVAELFIVDGETGRIELVANSSDDKASVQSDSALIISFPEDLIVAETISFDTRRLDTDVPLTQAWLRELRVAVDILDCNCSENSGALSVRIARGETCPPP